MRGVSTISTSHVGVLQDKEKSSAEYGFPTQDTHTILPNYQIFIHAERSIEVFNSIGISKFEKTENNREKESQKLFGKILVEAKSFE